MIYLNTIVSLTFYPMNKLKVLWVHLFLMQKVLMGPVSFHRLYFYSILSTSHVNILFDHDLY